MSVSPPLVSVVIPAYNAAWCVERAVRSVLRQTYRPLEVIVVDDGSTDDTAGVLQPYLQTVRLIRKQNGGLSSARNAGIAAALGEYVAFLDADDFWFPEKLHKQMALMAGKPSLGFTSTAAVVVDKSGAPLGFWRCPALDQCLTRVIFSRLSAVPGSGSSVVVRKDLFLTVGVFDETLRGVEDVDMWLRLSAVTEYGCVEEPLVVIERHGGGISRNVDVMKEATFAVLTKNRRLLPPSLRGSFWRKAYAAALADVAKWEYRRGRRAAALGMLARGLCYAPVSKARLILGLGLAMVRSEKL